jgi:hypothetical protein
VTRRTAVDEAIASASAAAGLLERHRARLIDDSDTVFADVKTGADDAAALVQPKAARVS